jgi:hypothetical protein
MFQLIIIMYFLLLFLEEHMGRVHWVLYLILLLGASRLHCFVFLLMNVYVLLFSIDENYFLQLVAAVSSNTIISSSGLLQLLTIS